MASAKTERSKSHQRYAAKLLFQLRFGNEVGATPMRLTEHRIVTLLANGPDDAYRKALCYGRTKQESFRNEDGVKVNLELVGVMDLMHLGAETDANEVWYEIRKMRAPMERRAELIPRKRDCLCFA